jgi:NADH:ubiquinone oxidoreductase subunit 3 (subunit A)
MGNLDANYLFGVMLVIIGLHYTGSLLYTRVRRESITKKYKPGVPGNEKHQSRLGIRRLVISIVITLLLIVNLIFDVRAIVHAHARSERYTLISVPIASVILFSVIYIVLYYMFKKKQRVAK